MLLDNGYLYETFNTLLRKPGVARDDTYLNAPLYYMLTGRGNVRIHEGYGAVMAVCPHPHLRDRLLVFPEIGPGRGRLAASVLSELNVPEGGVQLARFGDTDLAALKDALSMRNSNRIDTVARIEESHLDWRYPVHLLDTALVSAMDGSAFLKIRNKCRKVESDVDIQDLSAPGAMKAMRAAQKYWEGSMMMRGHDAEDISGYYATLFAIVSEWPHLFGGLVFLQGRRPVGFTLYDTPFNGTANLLANLSDASVAGLADHQVVSTCRALAARGVGSLNFGGSETESLDLFKRKFMPHKTVTIFSAEPRYAAQRDMHVRSGMLQASFAPA